MSHATPFLSTHLAARGATRGPPEGTGPPRRGRGAVPGGDPAGP